MVKRDLERVGIPYETSDGIADFHAAGRHSHITGLVRSGASIMEAKELARHADIRQTAKYTHIGMQDRTDALGNLPSPDVSAEAERLHIVCISGGVLGQEVSPVVIEPDPNAGPGNEQTPDCSGVVSSSGVNYHQMAIYIEVEAAGIAPASRDSLMRVSTCVSECLIVGLDAPLGGVIVGLSHHQFNPNRNGLLSLGDPALSSSGGASGRRPAAKPFLLLGSHTERGSPLGR